MVLGSIRLLLSTGRTQLNISSSSSSSVGTGGDDDDRDSKHRKYLAQSEVVRMSCCALKSLVLLMFAFVVLSFISALVHEKSKWILTMKQQEKYAGKLVLPALFDRAKHYYSQTETGLYLRSLSNKASKDDFDHAKRYYEEQKPFVLHSMDGYPLHAHFSTIKLPELSRISFHDMIKARGEMLLENLEKHGWEDYKIEKDKCEMFKFLKNNGLPHVDWLKIYRPGERVQKITKEIGKDSNSTFSSSSMTLKGITSQMRELIKKQKEFPLYIKSCHITTGAAKSVRKIHNISDVTTESSWVAIVDWAQRMWRYRSNDWERVWAESFNVLCSRINPGFMVQKPWKIGRQEYPEEIKVEVIWGRAYLAFVSTGKCGGDSLILRDGSVMKYTGSLSQNILHKGTPDDCYRWIVDEGHLPRVWFMAESAARLMGIDAIRIDVFVLKGNPMASVINEDSLSSGAEYRWHFPHMAELWALGHKLKKYRIVDPGVDSHKWWRGTFFSMYSV